MGGSFRGLCLTWPLPPRPQAALRALQFEVSELEVRREMAEYGKGPSDAVTLPEFEEIGGPSLFPPLPLPFLSGAELPCSAVEGPCRQTAVEPESTSVFPQLRRSTSQGLPTTRRSWFSTCGTSMARGRCDPPVSATDHLRLPSVILPRALCAVLCPNIGAAPKEVSPALCLADQLPEPAECRPPDGGCNRRR